MQLLRSRDTPLRLKFFRVGSRKAMRLPAIFAPVERQPFLVVCGECDTLQQHAGLNRAKYMWDDRVSQAVAGKDGVWLTQINSVAECPTRMALQPQETIELSLSYHPFVIRSKTPSKRGASWIRGGNRQAGNRRQRWLKSFSVFWRDAVRVPGLAVRWSPSVGASARAVTRPARAGI